MIKEYYNLEIKFGEVLKKHYIWCDINDMNTFLSQNGRILSFLTEPELEEYCKEHDLPIINEGNSIYIPEIKKMYFLLKKNTGLFCKILLNEWNIALDINKTFEKRNPYLDGCNALYDKVFRANNLEIFSKEGVPSYIPHFSKRDRKQLERILTEIYSVFNDYLL